MDCKWYLFYQESKLANAVPARLMFTQKNLKECCQKYVKYFLFNFEFIIVTLLAIQFSQLIVRHTLLDELLIGNLKCELHENWGVSED